MALLLGCGSVRGGLCLDGLASGLWIPALIAPCVVVAFGQECCYSIVSSGGHLDGVDGVEAGLSRDPRGF